ncbi:G-type lectin S-receptor-like serine/threonine-protein kinase LECRK3 [Curcuma longa]|uniref:G-type lectin S-receptor-like serine/threonine-protein kinase LECRK3 n=1 Tax=Curcuma longa TaxID=136217 RepID=UPI003D9F3832
MVTFSSSLFFFLRVCYLLLMISCSFSCAQRYRNVSLGSSLTPLGQPTSWLSPSGDFAFGFRPLETDSNSFLLAIWFDKIPEKTVVWYAKKTVVWYANGKSPVKASAGASVQLTEDGQLVLSDQTSTVWGATGVNNAAYGAMLDNGNFVLVGTDGSLRWQSFQEPTDTLLPSQALGLNSRLWSRLTDTDYSPGRFVLYLQSDGNLILHVAAVPSGYQYEAYWESNTGGDGARLIFDQTNSSVYIALRNDSLVNFTSMSVPLSLVNFYHRATLDSDGVFRQYVRSRNVSGTTTGLWRDEWNVVDYEPKDICNQGTSEWGSGICGYNSYCQVNEESKVDCHCPPNYSFLDSNYKYKGCKPDFPVQNCDANETEAANLFDFTTLINVDWPLADYERYSPMDEDRCRRECLIDCFCALAIYNPGGDCFKKRFPLSNGRIGNSENSRALIKVARGGNPSISSSSSPSREKGKSWLLVGMLLLGSSVLVFLLSICVVAFFSYNYNKKLGKKDRLVAGLPVSGLRSFTYKELEEATHGFREELGRGASGIVYKGFLEDEAATCVAVKKLDKVLQETEKEFANEVKSIGQTYHKNLVRLVGFCCQGTERLLVYEFMNHGSLMEWLTGDPRPSWDQRAEIAIGVARGLLYLHEECVGQIIHCDIKPQNVLLDDQFTPKISDFGLAKLLKRDQSRTRTDIRGTKGYVAPEWFRKAGVTAKVDVYSFGVMLLEIVCCRRNVELGLGEAAEEAILTDWVNDEFREGRLEVVVEGDEEAAMDMRRVERFVKVALWCVQEEPSMRPTMQKVAQMLDGAVAVPIPPEPTSYISSLA